MMITRSNCLVMNGIVMFIYKKERNMSKCFESMNATIVW